MSISAALSTCELSGGSGACLALARSAGFVAFLGLGSVVACRPSRPSGIPADAVQRFHLAAADGDCAAALGTLGNKLRARLDSGDRCAKLFQETLRHPLERVISTQVDGRDREAQLVRARLRGRATDLVIRVQAEDGQWKIVSM